METVSAGSAYLGHLDIFSIRVTPAYARPPSCLPSFLPPRFKSGCLFIVMCGATRCVGDPTWGRGAQAGEKNTLWREEGRCRSTSTATPLLEDESYWIIGHETPLRASIAAILPSLFANFFVFFFFFGGEGFSSILCAASWFEHDVTGYTRLSCFGMYNGVRGMFLV